jgi:hypothetical protein
MKSIKMTKTNLCPVTNDDGECILNNRHRFSILVVYSTLIQYMNR